MAGAKNKRTKKQSRLSRKEKHCFCFVCIVAYFPQTLSTAHRHAAKLPESIITYKNHPAFVWEVLAPSERALPVINYTTLKNIEKLLLTKLCKIKA